MPHRHCPYFQSRIVTLELSDTSQPLQLFVPRCHLAYAMRERLDLVPQGQQIAQAMTIVTEHEETHSMFGPDLDLPTASSCTRARYEQRCTPAFTETLTDLGLDASLPPAPEASE